MESDTIATALRRTNTALAIGRAFIGICLAATVVALTRELLVDAALGIAATALASVTTFRIRTARDALADRIAMIERRTSRGVHLAS